MLSFLSHKKNEADRNNNAKDKAKTDEMILQKNCKLVALLIIFTHQTKQQNWLCKTLPVKAPLKIPKNAG